MHYESDANAPRSRAASEVSGKQTARRLKALRVELDLTVPEVAERLAMSPSNWAHYESGRNALKADMLPEIARAYAVSPEYLVSRLGFGTEKPVSPHEPTLEERIARLLERWPHLKIALATQGDRLDEPVIELLVRQIETYSRVAETRHRDDR